MVSSAEKSTDLVHARQNSQTSPQSPHIIKKSKNEDFSNYCQINTKSITQQITVKKHIL